MKRRKVIALLMANAGLRDDYQGVMRSGIEKRCIQAGVDLWVYAGRSDWRDCGPAQSMVFELVSTDRVDGIIVVGSVIGCPAELQALHARLWQRCPVPIISVGTRLDGIASISIDNGIGMARVVNHLASHHRYRNFAFIAGPMGHEESEERLDATRGALARLGIELPAEAVVYGNFSPESGAAGVRQLLERRVLMDAVVAANDNMAVGALEVLVAQGRQCPGDIAIAGFDDTPISRMSTPSITTVRQPVFQLGALAADWIMAEWRGEAHPQLATLPTEALFRESCGCDPLFGSRQSPSEHPGAGNATQPLGGIAALLDSVVDDERQSADWANRLWIAVNAEHTGQAGALRKVIQDLLEEVPRPDVQLFELQRVVRYLYTTCAERFQETNLDRVFHSASIQIADTMYRREMRRRLQDGFLMEELRLSWERLATSLSFESLRAVLVRDLPRFSVRNAVISVYTPGDTETLLPLACLVDGAAVALDSVPFPARQLTPDAAPLPADRCSFAVMPLTFEWEPLGVALLELPLKEIYQVLREQIGSAVKTVRLHETLMQQQERLKLQAQTEKEATAERLRSMSLIAGGVAHDLNNALGPLLALPDAIRQDLVSAVTNLPEHILGDLDTLQDAAQHAASTIRDLLTLGRAIDIPKRILELNRILNGGRRGLSQLTERTKGARFILVATDKPLLVHVSRDHLLRAVSNLVVNAADAMSGPGDIVVRILERKLAGRLDGFEPVEPGHYAVIEVQDCGCGIPKENLPRVLEPFFSSKAQTVRGGTGLGLAIVHQVVKQSGGYVQVCSQLGLGTTFALYLPLVTQGQAAESVSPTNNVGGSERILVVDDERVQLRTAQRILSQLGYQVATAESGAAGFNLYQQCLDHEPFHLVILDMNMPGSLNGLQTLEQLRKLRPSQRAIFATGNGIEIMDHTLDSGHTHWLGKPYTAAELASAVRTAMDVPA